MFVTIFFFYHDTNNLVNGKTCFKCKNNPSCIEIFVTNSCNSFQNTSAITTGLSDSHKMVVIVLKTTFLKSKPRVITYRDYRSFDLDTFKADLKNFLRVRNVSSHLMSEEIFLHVLQRHTQVKQKVTRANHAPYVTKALRKAITKRTQLQHRYFNNRVIENCNTYKHQALSGEVCNCTGMHSHTCKSVYSCDKLHMQMKLLTTRFYYIIACV